MRASLTRILVGVLIAIPAVAAITLVLLQVGHAASFAAMLVGIALFQTAEYLHWRWAAASGGLLMFDGVLAWALVESRLV